MIDRRGEKASDRSQSPKDAGPIDRLIGKRIAMRRRERGISQASLAERIGISFQQLQKYEQGQNRMTVARLASVSAELDAPIGYFLVGAISLIDPAISDSMPQAIADEFEVHDLLLAFLRIEEEDVRMMIVNMVRAAADGTAVDRPLD
jgi:transcriptional regulator with XRE-family HTH domain